MQIPGDEFERVPIIVTVIGGIVAILGVSLAYWWLLQKERKDLNPGGAKRLGHVLCDGPLRRRHARTIQWVTLENRDPVFLRDLIFTLPSTSAQLVFDNEKRLSLPPGSMVQLDEETIDSMEIHLYEPSEHFADLAKSETPVPFPDPEVYEWRQSELFGRISARLAETFSLVALLPPVTRMSHGPLRPQLSDFELKLHSSQSRVVSRGRTEWLRLRWSPVPLPGIRYEVQLSREPNLTNFKSFLASRNEAEVPLAGAGTYYWRVLGVGQEERLTSGVEAFRFEGRKIVAVDPFDPTPDAVTPLSTRSQGHLKVKGRKGSRGLALSAPSAYEESSSLRKEDIDVVVQSHVREFKLCVEAENRSGRTFQGKVFLKFHINAEGKAFGADLKSDRDLSSSLEGCLKKKVEALKFARPKDGREVEASYPLVFATIKEP